jgi:uncharacterized protein YjiS (DUF1127 family)
MARVIHLPLDIRPLGSALVQIGAHRRAFTQFLHVAIAATHRRITASELQRLDNRMLHDLGLHREGQTVWRHLDALAPLERGQIVRPRY